MGIVTGGDLEHMRESGRIVRKALEEMKSLIAAGMSTKELEMVGRRVIEAEGAIPSFLGYNGYPAAVCVSINSEVVHGIPSTSRMISEGDLVSIDVGAFKNGFHGDAADTVVVGLADPRAMLLVRTAYEARDRGIAAARAGSTLGDVGAAIQDAVEAQGFSVVRALVGHGIGRKLHEPPQVPNFGRAGKGMKLTEGLAIAVEPMVNIGDFRVNTMDDNWTIVTADGSLSAHAEHTIVVSGSEPLILTA
ncbi:MAG: type I methionyl aminopeptidase [Candidatus Fermentibacteraceae bacterium]|nr:type I methionyl aminopeptidase [Candidatus Fermentibacteraceae bacterium]MBN2609783.1 type I methionyl aminopeptidase [Candidatus Fermentibacteraceae bacterium]